MEGSSLIAVTVVGNDRPGIVAGVTKVLFDLGCNLEDVTSTILRGHFSMVMIVQAPAGVGSDAIETSMESIAGELGLVVTARPVEEAVLDVPEPTHMVSVYGGDKPGIVFRVAELLAEHAVNITDLTSRVIGSSDSPVYALMLEVVVPGGLELEKLAATVKQDLGVELSVHPIEADLL